MTETEIRQMIENAARAAFERMAREKYEMYEERWVTATELSRQIAMFTPDWMEKYADRLPRERMEMKTEEGRIRTTRWCYPLHQIERELAEGSYRRM